jgi:hypothetical protein
LKRLLAFLHALAASAGFAELFLSSDDKKTKMSSKTSPGLEEPLPSLEEQLAVLDDLARKLRAGEEYTLVRSDARIMDAVLQSLLSLRLLLHVEELKQLKAKE